MYSERRVTHWESERQLEESDRIRRRESGSESVVRRGCGKVELQLVDRDRFDDLEIDGSRL